MERRWNASLPTWGCPDENCWVEPLEVCLLCARPYNLSTCVLEKAKQRRASVLLATWDGPFQSPAAQAVLSLRVGGRNCGIADPVLAPLLFQSTPPLSGGNNSQSHIDLQVGKDGRGGTRPYPFKSVRTDSTPSHSRSVRRKLKTLSDRTQRIGRGGTRPYQRESPRRSLLPPASSDVTLTLQTRYTHDSCIFKTC